MTPPISIGSKVIIIGPSITGCNHSLGETFKISHECQGAYSGGGFPWYPASSLRLAEPKLKIGDWVESNGTPKRIFQIESILVSDWSKKTYCRGNGYEFYAEDLRKLTPEEIQHHAAPKIVTPKPDWDEMMIKRATEAEKRLSAIESRLNSLGPSHAELMGDVEALAEKMSAMQKEIDILEGEKPEVCDEAICPKDNIRIVIKRGENKTYSTNSRCPETILEFAAMVLDRMREA